MSEGFILLLVGMGIAGLSIYQSIYGTGEEKNHKSTQMMNDDSSSIFQSNNCHSSNSEPDYINPATGCTMIGGIGGFDTCGNSYGTDSSYENDSSCSSSNNY
jgi:hypothetical protein